MDAPESETQVEWKKRLDAFGIACLSGWPGELDILTNDQEGRIMVSEASGLSVEASYQDLWLVEPAFLAKGVILALTRRVEDDENGVCNDPALELL